MTLPAVEPVVEFVAAWGLPSAAVDTVQPLEVGRHLSVLREHRLIGVAFAAFRAGELDVDRPDELAAAHEQAMAETLLLEDVMLAAVDALATAGIETRVLKGSALAHLVGDDPAERTFGDTDLLVPHDRLPDAVAALAPLGARRAQRAVSDGFERRFAKSVTLRWLAGTELDLHRTLAPGPYGLLVRPTDLFRRSSTFPLAGREVSTLTTEHHLLHAAMHAALGDIEPRLGNVRDLSLLLRRPGLDLDSVVADAVAWSCTTPVAAGLGFAADLGAGPHPLLDWAAEQTVSRRDRRLSASYTRRTGRFRAQARASLRVLGWRDRAAYVAAWIPSIRHR